MKAIAKNIFRRAAHIYTYWSYKLWFLPVPPSLSEWTKYRTESSKFDHFDFYPLPGDEANVHALWVADLITPATLHDAMRKLQRIQWKDIFATEDPEIWMESTRRISAGGWHNLGFANSGEEGFWRQTKISDIPKEFKYARFSITSITPSLSAIVGCFYFSDIHIKTYSSISKLHLHHEAVPHLNGSISTFDPKAIKERKISEIREQWRSKITKFMAKNFGTFLSSADPNIVPIIDLIEFSRENSKIKNFLIRHADEWEAKNSSIRWASFHGDHKPNAHSTAYFYTDDLDDEDLSIYGGKTAAALIGKSSRSLESNWVFESIHSLLLHYEKVISKVRDRNFEPISKFRAKSRFIKEEQSIEIADIQLVSDELKDEDLRWIISNMKKFEREDFRGERQYLIKILPKFIKIRAKRVSNNRKNVSAARKSLNDAYATFQMSNLTKLSLYTAIFSSIISLAALGVAALTFPQIQKFVLSLF